jgi:hypothetical protein
MFYNLRIENFLYPRPAEDDISKMAQIIGVKGYHRSFSSGRGILLIEKPI